MIDIDKEQLIPIRDVPRRLPPRPTGRRVHISAVYRWIQCGIRGVRLEAIKLGGTTYTSIEALQRFAERRTANGDQARLRPVTTKARKRQIERAAQDVEAILGANRSPHSGHGGDDG